MHLTLPRVRINFHVPIAAVLDRVLEIAAGVAWSCLEVSKFVVCSGRHVWEQVSGQSDRIYMENQDGPCSKYFRNEEPKGGAKTNTVFVG